MKRVTGKSELTGPVTPSCNLPVFYAHHPKMRLPQELITAIISEIPNVQTEHDAKDTLSACCLVAQSFLHSSRQKLWSHLTLPDPSENYLSDLYDTLLSSDTLPAPLSEGSLR